MKTTIPYIAYATIRGRREKPDKNRPQAIRYEVEVDIPEVTLAEAPMMATWTNPGLIGQNHAPRISHIRTYNGNFYRPGLVKAHEDDENGAPADLVFSGLAGDDNYIKSRLYRRFCAPDLKPYAFKDYQWLFFFGDERKTPTEAELISAGKIILEYDGLRGEKEHEARIAAEQHTLIIDGMVWYRIGEPRIIIELHEDRHFISVSISDEELVHGERRHKYQSFQEPPHPATTVCFRLDRSGDAIDYLTGRFGGVYYDQSKADLKQIDVRLPELLTFDDERDTLIRTAQAVFDDDLATLTTLSRKGCDLLLDMRDLTSEIVAGRSDDIDRLADCLEQYAVLQKDRPSISLINDTISRWNLRPVTYSSAYGF